MRIRSVATAPSQRPRAARQRTLGRREDDDEPQLLADVVEAVGDAGGHEEHVAGADLARLVAGREQRTAGGDDVDLVLGVGLLRIDGRRPAGRTGRAQRAAAQELEVRPAGRLLRLEERGPREAGLPRVRRSSSTIARAS